MALIKCPECNKEISSKSKVCIGCGYPLSEIQNEDSDTNCDDVIYATINGDRYDVTSMCACFVKMLKAGVNEQGNEHMKEFNAEIRKINDKLLPLQCRISFIELQKAYKEHGDQFPNEFTLEFKSRQPASNTNAAKPHCPKCNSTAITAGQRGYKLTTGFLGSNKTVNRCANCGHSWKPGKR